MKRTIFGLLISAFALSAGTLSFHSDANALNEFNSTANPNVKLTNIHSAWEPNGPANTYSWVSFAQTDGSAVTVPDNNANPAASFYETFQVGGAGSGSVRVWADDTAAVWFGDGVNWTLLMGANISQGGGCAAGPIGCQPGEHADLAFGFSQAGEYKLRFDVYQLGGGPFGVMYTGSADFADVRLSQTPEPASMAFAAIGLAAMGLISRRMKR